MTNINFLLTISIDCQEIRLWELIKWSPKRKCFDLLSNSLNLFFKEMYRDQCGEFVCSVWLLLQDISDKIRLSWMVQRTYFIIYEFCFTCFKTIYFSNVFKWNINNWFCKSTTVKYRRDESTTKQSNFQNWKKLVDKIIRYCFIEQNNMRWLERYFGSLIIFLEVNKC